MRHLVLAGAGHAHLETIQSIRSFINDGIRVSVIGPARYHYYSGMGPGMLGGFYQPEAIRFAVKDKVEAQGGVFFQDSVTGIDPQRSEVFLQSGKTLPYDLISFNTGSSIHLPPIRESQHVYPVKPIEGLAQAKTDIDSFAGKQCVVVAVVGGGPAGVEIAGNVAHLLKKSKYPSQIHLYGGSRLLAGFPPFIRKKSCKILENHGVSIHQGAHLNKVEGNILHFEDGTNEYADCIIICTGVHPGSFFKASGLPTGDDGGLLVNKSLQSINYPNIFGGGDCISFEPYALAKVGVYAVRENPVLLYNLRAFLQNERLREFDPGGDYLLIFNLGSGKGVLHKKWFHFSGRLAFRVKDFIDSKFMKKFR